MMPLSDLEYHLWLLNHIEGMLDAAWQTAARHDELRKVEGLLVKAMKEVERLRGKATKTVP